MTTPDQPTATPRTNALRDSPMTRADSDDFARTLETELSSAQAALAEAKAEVARLKEELREAQEDADEQEARETELYWRKQYEESCIALGERYDEWQTELTATQAALAEAKAEVARLKKTQAVCHCGELLINHGQDCGHTPVENRELCPHAEQVIELRARVAELEADKARLTELFLLAADLAERFFDPGPIPAGSPTEDDIQMGNISYEAQKLRNAARKEGA